MTQLPTTLEAAAPARAVLRAGMGLQQLAARVSHVETQLRNNVQSAFTEVRQQMLRRELAKIPVARLRDVTDGRLRLGVLERSGLRTVQEVLDAGPARLNALQGVGPTTAVQVVAAARQVAAAADNGLRVRIDLNPRNHLNTRLLAALRRYGASKDVVEPVRDAASRLTTRLQQDLLTAGRMGSRMRMLVSGRSNRQAAHEALGRIYQACAWADGAGISQQLTAASQLLDRQAEPPDGVWKDFATRSGEYYGWLGEIVDLGLDVRAAEGFLPADIVTTVNQQQLEDQFRRVSLRGYQAFGARFALVQRRVIIGDEMGLGKTIQAIAAIAHLRFLGHTHFLVVCPASVLVNWTREIANRSLLRAYRLHGPERQVDTRTWLRNGDVAVTTFDTLRTLHLPAGQDLGLLVVDEAHYVKNPQTKRTVTVKAWTDRTERVLFLTGTPMENRVEEFRNLVHHLQPRLAVRLDGHHSVAGPQAFRTAVAPAYLRRNQEDVLTELPDLIRADEWLEFTRQDAATYHTAVAEGRFMQMRRAAFLSADPRKSAKLQRLLEIVTEGHQNGRKVVIFSYFRAVLEIVHAALDGQTFGPLTGQVAPAERQRMIDHFSRSEEPAALLSQIQAGGVGLNIQAASIVVLCEPQVKPTLEDQAVARVLRIGQVRSVQLHRLLVADSVDQRMLEILAGKKELFDEYARRSDMAAATPDAVDISEVELARTIVAHEQERLAMEAIANQSATSAHGTTS